MPSGRPSVHWSTGPLVHWSTGPLVHWSHSCEHDISGTPSGEFLQTWYKPSLGPEAEDVRFWLSRSLWPHIINPLKAFSAHVMSLDTRGRQLQACRYIRPQDEIILNIYLCVCLKLMVSESNADNTLHHVSFRRRLYWQVKIQCDWFPPLSQSRFPGGWMGLKSKRPENPVANR